ncbi:MAG TPA: hypothetical protein VMX18_03555 [Candidatus Bipolaricaulota bacterium]|nr:hypothetical protein [Candidatus Bipolaricaulota bacterium]
MALFYRIITKTSIETISKMYEIVNVLLNKKTANQAAFFIYNRKLIERKS